MFTVSLKGIISPRQVRTFSKVVYRISRNKNPALSKEHTPIDRPSQRHNFRCHTSTVVVGKMEFATWVITGDDIPCMLQYFVFFPPDKLYDNINIFLFTAPRSDTVTTRSARGQKGTVIYIYGFRQGFLDDVRMYYVVEYPRHDQSGRFPNVYNQPKTGFWSCIYRQEKTNVYHHQCVSSCMLCTKVWNPWIKDRELVAMIHL